MSTTLSHRQIANALCKTAPRLLLVAAEFHHWPSQPNPAPCIHIVGCPHTDLEWFDPKRKHPPVIVLSRVPTGLSICRYCATEVIRRHRPVARKVTRP